MLTAKPPVIKEKVHVGLPSKLAVGAIAGVTGTTLIFPLDNTKTRLQSQVIAKDGSRTYKGVVDCFLKILRNEGPKGLYRGLGATLVGVIPEKAIKLASNDLYRELLTDKQGNLTLFREVIAGAGAGFTQVIATNPMEFLKIRMQLSKSNTTPFDIIRKEGIRGLYTGSRATLTRDVPFSALFFPLYANLRDSMADPVTGKAGMAQLLISGSIAGSVSAGIMTPADVVKTRLQQEGGSVRYSGVIDCFQKILREEGTSALFKGAIPRMVVMAPLFGIALFAFEMQQRWLLTKLNE